MVSAQGQRFDSNFAEAQAPEERSAALKAALSRWSRQAIACSLRAEATGAQGEYSARFVFVLSLRHRVRDCEAWKLVFDDRLAAGLRGESPAIG
jgi:hypothetical protein